MTAKVAAGRVVLGRVGRQVVAAEPAQSVIVFGPTQSHKTSGFAVPAILGWDGPVVAASVKTDLLEHTVGHRRSRGAGAVLRPDRFDRRRLGLVVPAARRPGPGPERAGRRPG